MIWRCRTAAKPCAGPVNDEEVKGDQAWNGAVFKDQSNLSKDGGGSNPLIIVLGHRNVGDGRWPESTAAKTHLEACAACCINPR